MKLLSPERLASLPDSPDGTWLRAEVAYQQHDYARAIELFEQYLKAEQGAPWQRYRALHRSTFSNIQVGSISKAREQLRQSEALLEAHADLRRWRSDTDAMQGHLLELQGDFEGTRAIFERAHRTAKKDSYVLRAASTASDLARILGILGKPTEALAWLDTAARLTRKAKLTDREETLSLRRAMLLAATGAPREALALVNRVVATATAKHDQGALVDGLLRRADIYRLQEQHAHAEMDLREAIAKSHAAKLERHELYASKDLASLLLERPTPDPVGASQAFSEALRVALAMRPPQALVLVQLAEDVLTHPELTGRTSLTDTQVARLARIDERINAMSRPSLYQRAARTASLQRLVHDLSEVLARLIVASEWIRLATCAINLATGKVQLTGEPSRQLSPGELATVRVLLRRNAEGTATADLAAERGITLDAATKSLMRLRPFIGDSISMRRVGRTRFYYLTRPR